jgi:hypothetical protein
MTRRLLNLLTLLSLLLCVAVVALWLRSDDRFDVLLVGRKDGTLLKLCSDRRGLSVMTLGPWPYAEPLRWLRGPFGTPEHNAATNITYTSGSLREWNLPLLDVSAAGWMTNYDEATGRPAAIPDVPAHSIRLPHGLAALALAILTAATWILRVTRDARRSRRASQKLCPICGYDLRATPERCPECGTIPAANAR